MKTVERDLIGSQAAHVMKTARDRWPIHAEEEQIAQVIHNILINTDQSMPEGGKIAIEAENRPSGSTPIKCGYSPLAPVSLPLSDHCPPRPKKAKLPL